MAHKILDAVDEVKEKLTDNEYKNIVESVRDLHEKTTQEEVPDFGRNIVESAAERYREGQMTRGEYDDIVESVTQVQQQPDEIYTYLFDRNLHPRSVIGQEPSFPFGPSRILKGEKPDGTEATACMLIFGLLLSVIFTIISIHFDWRFPMF